MPGTHQASKFDQSTRGGALKLLWFRMNLHFKRMILCLLIINLASCGGREPVDLLIVNASVYTVDGDKPWAQALAIRDGLIVAVGASDALIRDYEGEQLDLQGQMVLPGFHDSHSHLKCIQKHKITPKSCCLSANMLCSIYFELFYLDQY